ncbi:N-acetyltransferase eco [Topomyia yanbarensis]|uniref:N-acetyltransferase eco n=1 Tax=Topomyia yanbarensis TaxID=2498891 RepID=UPI00273CBB31|nr:N-acetyltransferase eco [Topomyia yanbarensis]
MRKQVAFDRYEENLFEGTSAVTPRDESNRITRPHHVPTPKMSGRKKALFNNVDQISRQTPESMEEESDLGPMSPLKFSNSPKRPPVKALSITSFRNILGNASPESDRSLSPDFERRFSHSELYEILPASYDKENHMLDEETRLSFPSETPRVRTPAQSALLDETNSNSLSLLMSSDLNIVEKRSHVLKTPGLSEANGQKKEPKLTFRKLSFNENPLTPSVENEPRTLSDLTNESKARTSLSFSDLRPISTKSFYSSATSQEAVHKPVLRTKQMSSIFPVKTSTKRSLSNQRKRPSTKIRDSSIRLGNFNRGVFHKIKKPTAKKNNVMKKLSTSQVLESTSSFLNISLEKAEKSKSASSTPQEPKLLQQLTCIKQLLHSSKNPIKRARPLSLSKSMTDLAGLSPYSNEVESDRSDEDEVKQYDSDDAKSEGGNRKFFKANSNRRIKREYKIINNVSATVRKGGKITLNRSKEKKRKYQSMFDEEFNFESEQLEVDDIINKLNQSQMEYSHTICDQQRSPEMDQLEPSKPSGNETEQNITDSLHIDISNDEPIPMQSNIILVDRLSPLITPSQESTSAEGASCNQIPYNESPMTRTQSLVSEGAIQSTNVRLHECPQSERGQEEKLFPIFNKNHQRQVADIDSSREPNYSLFDSRRRHYNKLHHWRPIGSNQYQIDAGQKEYGAQHCRECGLVYSVHEPEEELIHENYHNSLHKLRFAGWSNEPVIARVPEWDVSGRILAVTIAEGKQKLQKVNDVLSVVDRELGYIEPCQLLMGSVVYLAVARSLVLGVCVAQPLQQANRLLTIEGIEGSIDCCTMETYPAKCGISRIWVSPNFRGYKIARTLLTVMKSHFIFGYPLSYDEIAFSAPTEAGKRLAESVTGRKDFLIYM